MYDYSNECAKTIGYGSYGEYLWSDHWRKLRTRILASAKGRCQRCGTIAALQVHHTTYDNLGHEHVDDLIAVCRECHDVIHLGPFYVDAFESLEDSDSDWGNEYVTDCLEPA